MLPSAAKPNEEASQVEASIPTGMLAVPSPRDSEPPETSPVSDNQVKPQQSPSSPITLRCSNRICV